MNSINPADKTFLDSQAVVKVALYKINFDEIDEIIARVFTVHKDDFKLSVPVDCFGHPLTQGTFLFSVREEGIGRLCYQVSGEIFYCDESEKAARKCLNDPFLGVLKADEGFVRGETVNLDAVNKMMVNLKVANDLLYATTIPHSLAEMKELIKKYGELPEVYKNALDKALSV